MIDLKRFLSEHDSSVLLGLGLGFGIKATYDICRAAIKASKRIEAKKVEVAENSLVEITPDEVVVPKKEIVKETWRYFIPGAVEWIMSTGFILGSAYLTHKQYEQLMGAYILTKSAADRYQEAATEVVGKSKEHKIRETAARKQAGTDIFEEEDIESTGHGNSMFYLDWIGKPFWSSKEHIDRTINTLQFRMNNGEFCMSLNEFLLELGLSTCECGRVMGWNSDDMLEAHYTYTQRNGVPCGVITMYPEPHVGFAGYH